VELKLRIKGVDGTDGADVFNRTIVELKPADEDGTKVRIDVFNRTIVELKLIFPVLPYARVSSLIEPLWN